MSFKSLCFKKPLTAQAVAVGIQRPRTRRWAQVAKAAEKDPISSLSTGYSSKAPNFYEINREEPERLRLLGAGVVAHALVLAGHGPTPEENPLVGDTVVPALPMGGSHRLIDVAVGNLLRAGVQRVHILTQVRSRHLHKYVDDMYPAAPFNLSPHNLRFVRTLPCYQKPDRKSEHHGSADAVRSALERIRFTSQGAPPIEDVLVVSGQDLYNIDFREVLGLHRLRGADVTVVTRGCRHDEDNEMGFCALGSDHKRVETFVEKPSPQKMYDLIKSNTRHVEVSLGMYVFKRSMLESMLEDDMTREIGSISEDIIAPAVESGMHVTTFKHDGLFTNCSSIGAYMQAHMRFACAESHPEGFSFMLQTQRSAVANPKPPVLCSGAYLEDSTVSPGSFIAEGADLRQCVLGPWTHIGSGVRLSQVVAHGCTKPQGHLNYDQELEKNGHARGIGAGSVLKKAIVGYNASIGKNVTLVNKPDLPTFDAWENGFVVRDGVIVVLKGASIPDDFEF